MLSIRAQFNSSTEYDLPVLTPEVTQKLNDWYANNKFPELVNPMGGLVVSYDPPPRVNCLFWPVLGASRFAHGVFVIDGYTLGLLRADMALGQQGDAAGFNTVSIIFRDAQDDATETGREALMYLIAVRPVSREADSATDPLPTTEPTGGTEDDLFLITLVDARWYAVHQHTDCSAAEYFTEWDGVNGVFRQLMTYGLGASDNVDTVEAVYEPPSGRWRKMYMKHITAPYLVDDAAACVGSRVVCVPSSHTFDIRVQRPLSAYRTDLIDWHEAQIADERFAGGGYIEETEQLAAEPEYVLGVKQVGTTDQTAYRSVDKAGLLSSTFGIWHTFAWLDKGGSSTTTEYEDALEQWNEDWRAWNRPPIDAIYDGFIQPPASGYVGAIEWYHDSDRGYTRIASPPPNWVAPIRRCGWVCPGDEPVAQTLVTQVCVNTASGGTNTFVQTVGFLFPPGTYTFESSNPPEGAPSPSDPPTCALNPDDCCDEDAVTSSFDCVAGACVGVADASGDYATLEECLEACADPVASRTFDCVDGRCVEHVAPPGDGSCRTGCEGTYSSYAACQAACGDGPVITDCCPDGAPDELIGTITTASGYAVNIPTPFTLRWSAGLGAYTYSSGQCGGVPRSFILKCVSGTWQLTGNVFTCGTPVNAGGAICSPFSLTFTVSKDGCACGDVDFILNVTE